MRDQLVKWKETGIIGDNAIFYVVVGNQKYSMPYSWDQWLNLSISDLELLGLHGKKYNALLTPGDPTALQLLRDTIKQEISRGTSEINMKTTTLQITPGATCSLCGNAFSDDNTAKIIRLARERTKGVDVYAFICSGPPYSQKHTADITAFKVTYHKIEGEGFRTVVL